MDMMRTGKAWIRAYIVAVRRFRVRHLSLGLSIPEIARLYLLSKQRDRAETIVTKLFGKPVQTFNNYFWYLHSVDELFVDEIYKCPIANERPVIVDCGANIGLSIIYFKRCFPRAIITAFEPDKSLFSDISFNLKSFGCDDDVTLVNKAVWNAATTLYFRPDNNLGGSIAQAAEVVGTYGVEAIRLRDYLDKKIDFLKIDIEGAEFDVLSDCKDLLSNVENLFLEYHGKGDQQQELHQILQWIRDAGFRYHIKAAWANQRHPFVERATAGFDQQLNIFCSRV